MAIGESDSGQALGARQRRRRRCRHKISACQGRRAGCVLTIRRWAATAGIHLRAGRQGKQGKRQQAAQEGGEGEAGRHRVSAPASFSWAVDGRAGSAGCKQRPRVRRGVCGCRRRCAEPRASDEWAQSEERACFEAGPRCVSPLVRMHGGHHDQRLQGGLCPGAALSQPSMMFACQLKAV